MAETTDPFLWLEEVKGEKALAWVKEQDAKTEGELKSDPLFQPLLTDALAVLTAQDRIPYVSYRGGHLYNFWQDDVHILGLWRRTGVESYKTANPEWEVLIDLDKLSADEGQKWSFKGSSCLAPEYTRCLISLSPDGGDAVEIREFDINTKSFVAGGFTLPTNKSTVEWIDGDTVLVGTEFGEGSSTTSGYPRIAKLWKRGTPIADAKTVYEGKVEDTAVWPVVYDTPDGTIPTVTRAVDFFDAETYMVAPDGATTQLPLPLFAELKGFFKGQAVFSLRLDWAAPDGTTYKQGSLLAFSLDAWKADGKLPKIDTLFVPTDRTAVDSVAFTKDKAFVSVLDNVRGRIVVYDFKDNAWSEGKAVKLPENGTVSISDADIHSATVMFNYEDFLTPDSLYWSFDDGANTDKVKSLPDRFDASGYKIEQIEVASKDGTLIPYFVVGPKDRTGPLPTLLYAYGGFQVSTTPWYWQTAGKLWLARGNVFVIANIRGGGEFGPRWHEAGLKLNRQRVYDDFEGVAEDLIKRNITTPKQLGISGGSNGGLLVGVAFTQRPELFNAVLCDVPLLDMLRYTKLPPGASWIAEYGDPDVPEERAAIEKYSPYQNLKDGVVYPRVFFLTSTADDRVHPGHARKMAALMESKGYPFLFYEELEGGHGAATNQKQRAAQLAMQYVYLAKQLGGK
ncbi:Prolyl endopeptidase [Alphaproteobacteria bacterium SO-S41]|nr:Prolyl endopeptidase [Alphaproteobacteria bacterium SO-S41]